VGATTAGGRVRGVAMRPRRETAKRSDRQTARSEGFWAEEEFLFDPEELRRAFNPKTRAIVLNSPHNPTGKVFSKEELGLIAELCVQHDVIAITDEVYERLTFESSRPHLHLASFPGMAGRTVTLSSLGKSYSLTGWKIGWAIAAPELTKAVRASHQFLTFCAAVPLQHGAAEAIRSGEREVEGLVTRLREARDYLGEALARIGFTVYRPDGTYFIMVDHAEVGKRLGVDPADDVAFCRKLTTDIGVAAIPPSFFYDDRATGRRLARFAFCKRMETLKAAVERLKKLAT
jgi:aspartate/methionine/tyrosine aminotransferase